MPYLVNAVKFTEQGDKELLELTGELEAEMHPLVDAILALSSGESSRAAPPSFDYEAALLTLRASRNSDTAGP